MFRYVMERHEPKVTEVSFEDRWKMARDERRREKGGEQAVHGMICEMADSKREDSNLLYLREKEGCEEVLCVYSDKPLNEDVVKKFSYEIPIEEEDYLENLNLQKGDRISVFGRFAPTKCINHKKRSIQSFSERIGWVERKLLESGAVPEFIEEGIGTRITWEKKVQVKNSDKKKFSKAWLNAYDYEAEVLINDVEKFEQAIRKGIGRGRAYGCGMMVCNKIK